MFQQETEASLHPLVLWQQRLKRDLLRKTTPLWNNENGGKNEEGEEKPGGWEVVGVFCSAVDLELCGTGEVCVRLGGRKTFRPGSAFYVPPALTGGGPQTTGHTEAWRGDKGSVTQQTSKRNLKKECKSSAKGKQGDCSDCWTCVS